MPEHDPRPHRPSPRRSAHHAAPDPAQRELACTAAREHHELSWRDASPSEESRCIMQWIATGHAPSPALVDRFYRRIFVKLHHGLQRSRADAEDATQVVFLALTQRWRDIRTSPRQYAYGIARHGVHRHVSRRRRAGAEVVTDRFDDVPSEVPSAPEVVEAFDDVARLVIALGELPLEEQRCLAWVYGRELKNVEVAARLGVDVVTFNNRLRSARGRLREAMLRAELTGTRRERAAGTFAQWVDAVLGDREAQASRSSGPPFGNRSL